MREIPHNENADPKYVQDLTENDDPKRRKSITESEDPSLE
jgi:hypothetical protein